MSRWHWQALRWITGQLRHRLEDVLISVEAARGPEPYAQALKWWIEARYHLETEREEHGDIVLF